MEVIDSCFALLASLRSAPEEGVALGAVAMVLQQPGTPLHVVLHTECGVDVGELCRTLMPAPEALPAGVGAAELTIGLAEWRVLARIVCASAEHRAAPERVLHALHVTVTAAVAAAAFELARGVKRAVAAANATRPLYESLSMLDRAAAQSAAGHEHASFVADVAVVRRVVGRAESLGVDAVVEQLVEVLRVDPAVPDMRAAPLSRDCKNLWLYALDARASVGGMSDETRADLFAAALELSGRELFPAIASSNVAAELAQQRVLAVF
jgi:hypothetical protein